MQLYMRSYMCANCMVIDLVRLLPWVGAGVRLLRSGSSTAAGYFYLENRQPAL